MHCMAHVSPESELCVDDEASALLASVARLQVFGGVDWMVLARPGGRLMMHEEEVSEVVGDNGSNGLWAVTAQQLLDTYSVIQRDTVYLVPVSLWTSSPWYWRRKSFAFCSLRRM